jgi:OTU domain-containing protein 6
MSVTETEDQILARHRKENRDLIATVTGLKKQATKSKKKEVQKKCTELETNLKQKQEEELKSFHSQSSGGNGEPTTAVAEESNQSEDDDDDELTPEKLLAQLELEKKEQEDLQSKPTAQETPQQQQQQQQKGPKRNRQKERLAKRAALIEEQKKEAEAEASVQPNLRNIEQEHLKELCKVSGLQEFDIKPDGNCLFASIADQLELRQNIKKSIQDLRSLAVEHIRRDPDTFIPYLFDEQTMSLKNIDEYTKEIETTAAWGSDLEILALSKEFNCPISVMMSGRATLKINEEGANPELKLIYYKHSYALGEHYNSLHDA